MQNYLFISESVTEGHPDKLCDQVSDAVFDAILTKYTNARVACEVSAATGLLLIMVRSTPIAMLMFRPSRGTRFAASGTPIRGTASMLIVLPCW